jgi:hypothetical protein
MARARLAHIWTVETVHRNKNVHWTSNSFGNQAGRPRSSELRVITLPDVAESDPVRVRSGARPERALLDNNSSIDCPRSDPADPKMKGISSRYLRSMAESGPSGTGMGKG